MDGKGRKSFKNGIDIIEAAGAGRSV